MSKDFYAERRNFGRAVGVAVIQRHPRSGDASVLRGQWEPVVDDVATEPTLMLNLQEAQVLMDQLWNCGLRPSEGVGSAGAMQATQEHLKDMRNIAYAALRKNGIGGDDARP